MESYGRFNTELIVTQWDVNEKLMIFYDTVDRINSYIVGCKFIKNIIQDYRYVELIVTQWDVNIVASKYDYVNVFELIVTQWDVNAHA